MAVRRIRNRHGALRKAEGEAVNRFLDNFTKTADGMSSMACGCGCPELDELSAHGISLAMLEGADDNDDINQLLQPLMSVTLPPAPMMPRPGWGCGIGGSQQTLVSSMRPGAERVPDGQCGEDGGEDDGEDGQCDERNSEGTSRPAGWETYRDCEKSVPSWLKGDHH
eukprot:gnl/TRDRNA2_/TRDRNA2_153953_c0_seq3.p1 gnl/TRDRNA2_/TRDRNA2_153953_c0~~gnl/TRDRNA2_/TRDRNA2_153953_c0_seq3.p1  ORF type:complete len:167 (-),score=19.25 gnl/TRDRNA2_/TRDRNA2_153953_c0_seq3:187-687(-)